VRAPEIRILFSSSAAEGHFRPLVPLARACADAGHEVAFATAADLGDRVAAAGFRHFAAGLDQAEIQARHDPYRKHLLTLPPHERRALGFSARFAGIEAPGKVAALRTVVERWKPDVIVHESADLAAPLVAALLELPSVNHSFGRVVPRVCFERGAESMAALWTEYGLDTEPFCGVYRGAFIDICPSSLRPEALPVDVHAWRLRPAEPPPGTDSLAQPWVDHASGQPTVYVTLGTIFNDLALFAVVLDALAEVEINVLVTIGRDNDPASLEPLPANAIVERYIPQAEVLPHVELIVSHGGSGSMLAALAHGMPNLLLPRGADQFENAEACRAAGAARVLMPDEVTVDAVRAETIVLLDEPSYRERAQAIADEIAAMPSPAEVASLLVAV